MDLKITNLALQHLVLELDELLQGAFLKKVQELPNNWLKLKFNTKNGLVDVIASPTALFTASYSIPAKHQSSGFGALLRKRLANKKVTQVSQNGFDRVIKICFADYTLVFELFAKGNLLLLEDKKIEAVYRREKWKDRVLKKGEIYLFPKSRGLSPVAEFGEFKKVIKEKEGGIAGLLVRSINIAPAVAESACEKSGIEKSVDVSSLSEKQLKELNKTIKDFYSENKKGKSCLVETEKGNILLPCFACSKDCKEFDSFSQAIETSIAKQATSGKKEKEAGKKHGKKIEALKRALEEQKAGIENYKKLEIEQKEKAELIYTNYQEINRIILEAREVLKKGGKEKEIMYKIKSVSDKIKNFDAKSKKLILEIE